MSRTTYFLSFCADTGYIGVGFSVDSAGETAIIFGRHMETEDAALDEFRLCPNVGEEHMELPSPVDDKVGNYMHS